MNYLAQAVMLMFQLCVQEPKTGDWAPATDGSTIAVRQSAIVGVLRTADDDCTGVAVTARIYHVVGSFSDVLSRISEDLR